MTRLAALTAGIDQQVPAVTLDLQCGSALEAVTQAAAKIESAWQIWFLQAAWKLIHPATPDVESEPSEL